uniref:Xylose isomerase domain-containing protein TIM barrel n=1 Tax=uncultured bacterium Contig783 TaxID=1393612 RepID=W0FMN1_9BACT|nr:xylose isomerase domain-containing protein TIM barrel [uncultured bacterium Contig783]
MRAAVSNIAWQAESDDFVLKSLPLGIEGLEIAPTRIVPESPYENIPQADAALSSLRDAYGFCFPSMQSIWYGISQKLFGSPEERGFLLSYTKKAVDFASALSIGSLVFGSPKNRVMNDPSDMDTALEFFRAIGDYAFEKGVFIGLEANPEIYGTNFITTTSDAFAFVKKVGSKGLKVNLDMGTMKANGESADIISGNIPYISHVHLSEPYLKAPVPSPLHREVIGILKDEGYGRFVSLEMNSRTPPQEIPAIASYLLELLA